MSLTDEEILKRIQRGDRQEYIKLFDRYHSRVELYARRLLRNSEAARDAASETFLRAFRNVDSFRIGDISYLGYLFLICRRLVITEQSRMSKSPTYPLEENYSEIAHIAENVALPLEKLLTAERGEMIRQALKCLSEDDREIIYLAFERDLSRRDIGDIMGKPSVSAVTSHLFRAMQKLKTIVVEQGYFAMEYQVERK